MFEPLSLRDRISKTSRRPVQAISKSEGGCINTSIKSFVRARKRPIIHLDSKILTPVPCETGDYVIETLAPIYLVNQIENGTVHTKSIKSRIEANQIPAPLGNALRGRHYLYLIYHRFSYYSTKKCLI